MNLRDSILIRNAAIRPDDLQFLARYVRQSKLRDSLVSNFEDAAPEGAVEWVVNKQIRDTQEVELTATVAKKLHDIVDTGARAFIAPFFGVQVRDWEPPHILHY